MRKSIQMTFTVAPDYVGDLAALYELLEPENETDFLTIQPRNFHFWLERYWEREEHRPELLELKEVLLKVLKLIDSELLEAS